MLKKLTELIKRFKKTVIVGSIVGTALAAPLIVSEVAPSQGGPAFLPTLNDETVVSITTWGCENSSYEQDFEPTVANMAKHFGSGYSAYVCPDGIGGKMIEVTDPDKKMKVRVAGPSYIENEIIQEDWDREQKKEVKMNDSEKEAYRAKRLQDIQDAVKKAKLLESK